jgi:hypothetical protein
VSLTYTRTVRGKRTARVVIGTNRRRELKREIAKLEEWLGVEVQIAKPLKLRPLAACKCSPRNPGVVTGCFVHSDASGTTSEYGVTCAHVIPNNCEAKAERADLGLASEPDAVLLKATDTCFPLGKTRKPVSAAGIPFGRAAAIEETQFRRLGGPSRKGPGLIEYSMTEFPRDGVMSTFPAFTIARRRLYFLFGLMPWPPFCRFSRPGDSGSWVVTGDGATWLGMITHGARSGTSVGMYADALLTHFQDRLRSGKTPQPFSIE